MPVVLAALPEMLIALVVLLVIWAARALFGSMLSSFASRIPLLGSVLSSAIDAIIADVVAAGMRQLASIEAGAESLMLAPIYWIEHVIADVVDFADTVGAALKYVVTGLIPQMVNLAVSEAEIYAARLVQSVQNEIAADMALITTDFARVYATMTAVEKALEGYALELFTAAERYTEQAIAAETAFVVQEVGALENQITQAIDAETAFVQAEFRAAVSYTEQVAAGITAELENDFTKVIDYIGAVEGSLTTAIATVQAASIAFTATEVAVVEAEINNLKKDCLDNLCSGAGSLASLLNQLFDTAALAALVAYAGWMGADPRGAGNATADVLAPIASGAAAAARDAMAVL